MKTLGQDKEEVLKNTVIKNISSCNFEKNDEDVWNLYVI